MASAHNSSKSAAVLIDVIRELSGSTRYASTEATVSATIDGKLKIDSDIIRVILVNGDPNFAQIDIFWEDYGYKNYKDMGLFGRMNTQYQSVEKVAGRVFRITGDNYQIDIGY